MDGWFQGAKEENNANLGFSPQSKHSSEKILGPEKVSFENKSELMTCSYKQELREFGTGKSHPEK